MKIPPAPPALQAEPPLLQARSLLVRDGAAMQALGETLAHSLWPGDVLLLEGELGAGKTTLAQGVARGLGISTPVTSPTFVLLIEHRGERAPLLHLDAYRLEGLSYDQGREAGLEEFFSRRDAIRLVEWPSMIGEWIEAFCAPGSTWSIGIEHEGQARRVQVLAPPGREENGEE